MRGRLVYHHSRISSLRIHWKLVMAGEGMDDEKTPAKGPLKTNALAHLPNATQADFWLQRAHNCQSSGNHQVIACAISCFQIIGGLSVWRLDWSIKVESIHWYKEFVEGLPWPSECQKTSWITPPHTRSQARSVSPMDCQLGKIVVKSWH